MTTLSCGSPII